MTYIIILRGKGRHLVHDRMSGHRFQFRCLVLAPVKLETSNWTELENRTMMKLESGVNSMTYALCKVSRRKLKARATLPRGRKVAGRYLRNIIGDVAEKVDARTSVLMDVSHIMQGDIARLQIPAISFIPHTVIPSGDRHTKVGLPDDQSPDCFKACTISCDQYFSQQLNGSITCSNSRVGNHSINSQSNRSGKPNPLLMNEH